jgi:hypothetical protein
MIAGMFHLVWKFIWNTIVILICAGLIFVGYKASQPMSVYEVPEGMTYAEFIQDRLDAAKTVKPSRCGWGMMVSLATLGPIYSVVYTAVAINPNGTLAKMTASDPDIPKGVDGAKWYEVPGIWWGVVERLSWTMLGKPDSVGCQFRAVLIKYIDKVN